jgi:hypothetical protein
MVFRGSLWYWLLRNEAVSHPALALLLYPSGSSSFANLQRHG